MKINFEVYNNTTSIPQYFATRMVKSTKIKCYRNYKSKPCLEIHKILLPRMLFALQYLKRWLASHSLNQLAIARIPGSTLFIENLRMLHTHLRLHRQWLCNIPQVLKSIEPGICVVINLSIDDLQEESLPIFKVQWLASTKSCLRTASAVISSIINSNIVHTNVVF